VPKGLIFHWIAIKFPAAQFTVALMKFEINPEIRNKDTNWELIPKEVEGRKAPERDIRTEER
jgi:hypothetical protein